MLLCQHLHQISKKLVLVLTTFLLVIDRNKKIIIKIPLMLWPRDLSRDLICHYIQRHFTKSTDCTYLSPCS